MICIIATTGAFLTGLLTRKIIDSKHTIATTPDLGDIFDTQYRKGMGFKNQKFWAEKKGGIK